MRVQKLRNGRARYDLRALPLNEQYRMLRGGLHPKQAAWAVALLRAFADGKRSPLRKRLSRRHRRAAQDILARIDKLPRSVQRATFSDNRTEGKPRRPKKQRFGPGNAAVGGGVSTHNLPAQQVADPDKYKLQLTGVAVEDPQESDGDELVTLAAFIVAGANPTHNVAALPDSGALSLNAGEWHAKRKTLFDGKKTGVVVTAVFETDGDTDRMAEFETMLGLAEAMAQQNGGGSVGSLAFALDQTAGVLSISDPDGWPPGTLTTTIVGGQNDPLSLKGMYGSEKSKYGGIDYKLVHPHVIGSAEYKVFFTVPAPTVHAPTVVVKVEKVEALAGNDPGGDKDDLGFAVAIGNQGKIWDLLENDDAHSGTWIVKRPMVSDEVPISIGLWDYNPSGSGYSGYDPMGIAEALTELGKSLNTVPMYGCGSGLNATCPDYITLLDVGPRKDTNPFGGWGGSQNTEVAGAARMKLFVATGKIEGAIKGDVGDELIATGNIRHPRGRITFRVEIER